MTYYEIQKIYTQLFQHPVVSFYIKLACGGAILFVIVQLVRKFLKSAGDPGNKMKPYDFIRPAIIIAILLSFNVLLNAIDTITTATDKQMDSYFNTAEAYDQEKELQKLKEQYEDPNIHSSGMVGLMAKTVAFIEKLESYPLLFLWDILGALGELINSITYTVAIVIRFAMLFFLRCFGPIALVFAIVDKYENSFWNWVRQYSFYYLWLYALFVINLFFKLFRQYTGTAFTYSHNASDIGWTTGCLILAAVVAKIILYKRSYTLLGEVITGK